MITNSEGNNLKNKILEIISEIQVIFYEILNLYTLEQFNFKENFSIYNQILQLEDAENKIETDPEKLLSELIIDLSSLNNILKEINLTQKSKSYNCNFKIYSNININQTNDYLLLISKLPMKYNLENEQTYFAFEDDIYKKLKEKELLIKNYFTKLKIKYILKDKSYFLNEYIQIEIIVNNLFCILIIFPLKTSLLLNDNDTQKNIVIMAKGLFEPNKIYENNNNFNNYSKFHLFRKLTFIFNSKFKQIIKQMKESNLEKGEKISFYNCFIQFLDYVQDYDKIFGVKCEKCLNRIKYITCDKSFSVPLFKIQHSDSNYIKILINDIEEGININKKIFHFFHLECINNIDNI